MIPSLRKLITRSNGPLRPGRGFTHRQGAALTEFLMVVPLLFFFFVVAIEICRVAMIRHTVDNAVYEGCHRAMTVGATAADARASAAAVLDSLGVHETAISVEPAMIDNQTDRVTVSVEVDLRRNSFVPSQFAGGETIVRTLTMNREFADRPREPDAPQQRR